MVERTAVEISVFCNHFKVAYGGEKLAEALTVTLKRLSLQVRPSSHYPKGQNIYLISKGQDLFCDCRVQKMHLLNFNTEYLFDLN